MTPANTLKNGLCSGMRVQTAAHGILRIFRIYPKAGVVKLVDGNGKEVEVSLAYAEKLKAV